MPPTRQRTTRSRTTRAVSLYELKQEPSTSGSALNSEEQELDDLEDAIESPTTTPKRKVAETPSKTLTKKAPSKKKSLPPLAQALNPPPRWEEQYEEIKKIRSTFIAPVDTMGCASLGQVETTPENRRFATLVSLVLSSQTTDEKLYAGIASLRAALGGTISVDAVLRTPKSDIFDSIQKLGMGNKKSQYLKEAAELLRDRYNSDVPKTAEEIMTIKGVGPKMAYLCLSIAWGIHEGIGVDVHVHRITNLLRWHGPKGAAKEDQTRVNLESWLPRDKWLEINQLMVGFGQVICVKGKEKCDQCPLGIKKLCPSRRVTVTSTETKVRTGIIKQDVVEEEGEVAKVATEKIEYEEVKVEVKEELGS